MRCHRHLCLSALPGEPEDLSVYAQLQDHRTGHRTSNNTVRKYVLELEATGLIATNRTVVLDANGKERNGSLRYTILPVQQAVELYHQRQLAALDAAAEQQRVKKRLAASARKGGAAQ